MRKKIVIAAFGFGLLGALASPAGVALANHDGNDECEMPSADVELYWPAPSQPPQVRYHVDTGPICLK